MKTQLSWFDKLMIGVTYAEENTEEPDLQHGASNDWLQKKQEVYGSLDGEAVASY